MSNYILEAFKRMDALDESEDFSLGVSGVEGLKSFMDEAGIDPDEENVDIIDLEAEAEEDLKNSYMGKVIVDCNVCHSNIFFDKDEIEVDEDGVVNSEIECPYCMSTDGYTLIGEVAPFNEEESEELQENPKGEEETEIEVDTDNDGDNDVKIEVEKEEDELEESLNINESSRDDFFTDYGRAIKFLAKKLGIDKFYDEMLGSFEFPANEWDNYKELANEFCDNLPSYGILAQNVNDGDILAIDNDENLTYILTDMEEAFDGGDTEFVKIIRHPKESIKEGLKADKVKALARDEKINGRKSKIRRSDKLEGNDEIRGPKYKELDEGFVVVRNGEKVCEVEDKDEARATVRQLKKDDRKVKETASYKIMSPEEFSNKGKQDFRSRQDHAFDWAKDIKNEPIKEGWRGSNDIEMGWNGEWSDPDLFYNGDTYNYWDIEDAMWDNFLDFSAGKWVDNDCDNPECEAEFDRYVQDNGPSYLDDVKVGGYFKDGSNSWHDRFGEGCEPKKKGKLCKGKGCIKESTELNEAPVYELSPGAVDNRKSFYNKARVDDQGNVKTLYSYNTPVAKIEDGKASLLPKWDSSATTLRHVKEFLAQNDFEIGSKSQLQRMYESIEGATIETDKETMTMSSNPEGGVVIETMPKSDVDMEEENLDNAEMVAPISDETIDDIAMNQEEPEEISFNEPFIDDEEEMPFDEFDEESFDGLGESYLKRCYENVNGFNTTSATMNESKQLVIEGNISFTSGNVKATKFVFENFDIKNNKVKLVGFNENISKGKKSFKLGCRLDDKKLMCESLNYNYKSKNELNESIRVYGTVKKKK